MPLPMLDRSLRLPLALALLMVGGFVLNRWHANRTDLGWRDYNDECGICHHGGRGQANETPPLFGRIDQIAQTPEGKRYVMHVLLNGLSGPINVHDQEFSWSMPNFRNLSDKKIARILTWVAQQGQTASPPHFTAEDIAAERNHHLSSEAVREERERLDRRQPLP